MAQPLIFISNDDGLDSKGIHHLIDILESLGARIIAAAPAEQHSGQSSAITVSAPVRIKRHADYKGAEMYAVDGTPVDCVKISLHTILPGKPSLMLSGINHGSNAGNCAIYSGTMGAAMEACMAGIPSVGFSLLSHDPDADFSGCDSVILPVVKAVLAQGLPKNVCLNVNIPYVPVPAGVKVLRAALGAWTDEYEKYTDPHGRPFYMLKGHFVNEEPDAEDTDEYWLARGYASVVPVRPDQSDINAMPVIRKLLLKNL